MHQPDRLLAQRAHARHQQPVSSRQRRRAGCAARATSRVITTISRPSTTANATATSVQARPGAKRRQRVQRAETREQAEDQESAARSAPGSKRPPPARLCPSGWATGINWLGMVMWVGAGEEITGAPGATWNTARPRSTWPLGCSTSSAVGSGKALGRGQHSAGIAAVGGGEPGDRRRIERHIGNGRRRAAIGAGVFRVEAGRRRRVRRRVERAQQHRLAGHSRRQGRPQGRPEKLHLRRGRHRSTAGNWPAPPACCRRWRR